MEVSVYGTKNKKTIRELSKAAEFFALCLMHTRTVKGIELDIEVVSNLEVQGYCVNEDDTKRSRFFTIQLRKDDINDMIQTLAHEMIHVKQYVKNEHLKRFATTKGGLKIESVWLGKVWRPTKGETHYYDSPGKLRLTDEKLG